MDCHIELGLNRCVGTNCFMRKEPDLYVQLYGLSIWITGDKPKWEIETRQPGGAQTQESKLRAYTNNPLYADAG